MPEEKGRITPRRPVVDTSLCITILSELRILILAEYFSAPWCRGGHLLPTIRLGGVMYSCQYNVSGDDRHHTHLNRALPGWLSLISVRLPQEPRSSERCYSFSPRLGIRTHAAQEALANLSLRGKQLRN